MTDDQNKVQETFRKLRDKLVNTFQNIDGEKFTFKKWDHSGSGGGEMGKIRGPIIEKGGVNISTVSGVFSDKMKSRIPGTKENANYWATGISVVLHPKSPLIPSMHFNSRYLNTQKKWFGGGLDVTPSNEFKHEAIRFHQKLKDHCDDHDLNYYKDHKKWCDEYFFLKHRNESRGIGGIFFDYLNTDNHKKDFNYVKKTGDFFHNYSKYILKKYKDHKWTEEHRKKQLIKRSRYVEFNLLYDRGTKFGLETGGNTEAILMSMPPLAAWE